MQRGWYYCDQVTSLLRIVALDIHNICLEWTNESMHMAMVFSQVEDGLGTLISQLKY
jgi:hypothetical protein